jgi:MFS superfamily sulfate permease-like transporter
VIVLDQLPKLFGIHIAKHGFFADALAIAQHLPEASLPTLLVALATFAVLIGMERLWPHSPAPLVAVGGSIAASWFLGLHAAGVSTVGFIPQGFPSLTLPDLSLVAQLAPGALGIALMSFTETIAAGRAFASPDDPPIDANREMIATGAANLGGALFGAMPAGGRDVADRRRARRRRAHAEGVAGDGGDRARDDAAARAAARPDAARDARGGRHRLLGGTDPARRVPRDPRRAHDGVPLGADRVPGRAAARNAAGHRRGDRRVDDRAGEPDRPAARVGHRAQARRRRAAPLSPEHPDDETFDGLLILRPEGRCSSSTRSTSAERIGALVAEHQPRVVALDLSRVPDIEYSALETLMEGERRATERGVVVWLAGLNPGVLETFRRAGLDRRLGDRMLFNARAAIARYATCSPRTAPLRRPRSRHFLPSPICCAVCV